MGFRPTPIPQSELLTSLNSGLVEAFYTSPLVDRVLFPVNRPSVDHVIEEVRWVRDHYPLEFVVWSNEEGGKTGSRAVLGAVEPSEFDLPSLGERTLVEGRRLLGGNPDEIGNVARPPGEAAALATLTGAPLAGLLLTGGLEPAGSVQSLCVSASAVFSAAASSGLSVCIVTRAFGHWR